MVHIAQRLLKLERLLGAVDCFPEVVDVPAMPGPAQELKGWPHSVAFGLLTARVFVTALRDRAAGPPQSERLAAIRNALVGPPRSERFAAIVAALEAGAKRDWQMVDPSELDAASEVVAMLREEAAKAEAARPSGPGRRLPLFSPWGDPCRVRSIAKVRIMDTSFARLEPIPAKFRSLAARIPDVDDWREQAGRLIMEYINAGGLDDPNYAVAVIRIREAFDGWDRRPGGNDWSGAWHVARQQLLTPEQLAAWLADLESATPPPKERFIEHYANHCSLMADFLDKDVQRIREQALAKAAPEGNRPPPMTDTEKAVHDNLASLPEGQGLTARELANRTGYPEPSIRNHIIPALRKLGIGVPNRKGVGYYLDRRP